MSAVISKPNDALNLLFEAAEHQEASENADMEIDPQLQQQSTNPGAGLPAGSSPESIRAMKSPGALSLKDVSPQVLDVWGRFKFVKQDWFTAREAVYYIDMFYQNLSHLSPIVPDYYADHGNHLELITKEPVLCCAMLTLSSRYNKLPGVGGTSRGYFIHDRLWKFSQCLFERVMWGQEKAYPAKTRTIGTIETFLLMTEWHPRHLHFPPDVHGWDIDLINLTSEEQSQMGTDHQRPSNRWLDEITDPARRSDRMSWMLIGSALSLAHELGIFDHAEPEETGPHTGLLRQRQRRVRKLLYVFVNQLASRLGCSSMMPRTISHSILTAAPAQYANDKDSQWHVIMSCWIELTRLMKSASELLFPSRQLTRDLLRSGKYISSLEHFQPLLEQWKTSYLHLISMSSPSLSS
jgi:hypothetical protein